MTKPVICFKATGLPITICKQRDMQLRVINDQFFNLFPAKYFQL
jgi:hypothetical protein